MYIKENKNIKDFTYLLNDDSKNMFFLNIKNEKRKFLFKILFFCFFIHTTHLWFKIIFYNYY